MKKNTYIIAEVAQAHDGSLGTAFSYIDAVAKSGADAINFQTHFAEEESTYDEPWRVKFSIQDKFRFDYWKRLEFTEEQWTQIWTQISDEDRQQLSQIVQSWGSLSEELKRAVLRFVG